MEGLSCSPALEGNNAAHLERQSKIEACLCSLIMGTSPVDSHPLWGSHQCSPFHLKSRQVLTCNLAFFFFLPFFFFSENLEACQPLTITKSGLNNVSVVRRPRKFWVFAGLVLAGSPC